MPRQHKVLEVVKDRQELEELEKFVRDRPGRKVDEVHEWLLAKGYVIGRTAVHNWKAEFEANDRMRSAAEISRNFLAAGKEEGAAEIASASLLKFQQILFEHLLGADDADAGELMKLSISLKTAVQAGRHIEELREQFETKQKNALAEAEKLGREGATGEMVVAKVREYLGLK